MNGSVVVSNMHLSSNRACEALQYCRVCAQDNRTLISIFGEEGIFRQLITKLRYCLQIIVSVLQVIIFQLISWFFGGNFESLYQQLNVNLFSLQVLENDGLPTSICWKCLSKLEICFELMQEHIKGQNEFRRLKLYGRAMPLAWENSEVSQFITIYLFIYSSFTNFYIQNMWLHQIS